MWNDFFVIVRHFHETYGVTVYLEPGRSRGSERRFSGDFCSGNACIMEWILLFWIPLQPATCRMFWKCPIVRLCKNSGATAGRNHILIAWADQPAWPAM